MLKPSAGSVSTRPKRRSPDRASSGCAAIRRKRTPGADKGTGVVFLTLGATISVRSPGGRAQKRLPAPYLRLLKKGLPRPKNKDLRHEFDREIRTYVDGPDFFSSLYLTWEL